MTFTTILTKIASCLCMYAYVCVCVCLFGFNFVWCTCGQYIVISFFFFFVALCFVDCVSVLVMFICNLLFHNITECISVCTLYMCKVYIVILYGGKCAENETRSDAIFFNWRKRTKQTKNMD